MKKINAIETIKGITPDLDSFLSWEVKNKENFVANIELKIPENRKSTQTTEVDLSDFKQYKYDSDMFEPFPCFDLCRYLSWKLEFEGDMKLPDQYSDFGSYFNIGINIVKVTDEFDNVFRQDVFEGAVARDIYNNWGPGKYEFDYDSGIGWHYETINNVRWLSFLSRFKETAVKMNDSVSHYETWLTPVSRSHILKVNFSLTFYSANKAHKPILDYLTHIERSIIESIKVKLSQEQEEIQKDTGKIYPEIEEVQKQGFVWNEKPLESSEEIYDRIFNRNRDEAIILETYEGNMTHVEDHMYFSDMLNETNYFDDTLLYNPYDSSHKNIKIILPEPVNPDDPVIKEMFRQQKELAEQMRKTLKSHINYKNNLKIVK